eukprot:701330_1
MFKARSSRRVIIPKLQHGRALSPLRISSSKTSFGFIKQLLAIGLVLWLFISIMYCVFYIFTSKSTAYHNNPTTPPALRTKLGLEFQEMEPNKEPKPIKIVPKEPIKFGHPSETDMPNPCIVILTYNRPQQLLRTVNSLKSLEGVTSYQIYISQDGHVGSTTNTIRNTLHAIPYTQSSDDITIIKHIVHEQARNAHEPTSKLAIHYKFMFDIIFNELRHSHAIILEDDMIFSADFLEYFAATVPLLNDEQNDLFCISSWNDYGQTFFNHDGNTLFRTDYFPGLGWLLKKSLWNEIEALFPDDHWDHFMRIDTIAKGRDCIYPDVSRNYNIGEIGSTMDNQWYNMYLKPMQFDEHSRVQFRELDLTYLSKDNYEADMIDLFKNKAKFIGIFPQDSTKILRQLSHPDVGTYGEFMLIPYHGYHWQRIANTIGVMETQRTRHKNVIMIKKHDVVFIFANIRLCPYLKYNDETSELLESVKNKEMVIVTGNTGRSCDASCRDNNMKCLEDHFEYVNQCSVLYQQFECEAGCLGGMVGEDVPNYVSSQKPGLYQKCLTTDFAPTCRASHRTTSRICPCA